MKYILFIQENGPWVSVVNEALRDLFNVTSVATVGLARELMTQKDFDMVLVDGVDAASIAFPLSVERRRSSMVFVYLSHALGRSTNIEELVQAFQADYDEYFSSSVSASEMKTRLLARFKNRLASAANESLWRGSLRLVIPQQRVVHATASGERDLELTPNEFRILYALAIRERQTLSRDQILKEAWGDGLHVEARTVDKHVCSLRRKLGGYAKALMSVAGKGYLFDAQLAQAGMNAAHRIQVSADL